MKRIALILLCFLALSALSAQDLQEVLNNYYETVGMDKLRQVNNMVTKGKINQMGMDMTYTVTVTRSGKMHLEVPLQGMTMIRAYDGQVGWMIAPWTGSNDPIVLGEFETRAMKQELDIDGILYEPESKGYAVEFLGKQDMEGSPVYVIQLTDSVGDQFKYHLDAENFVVLKVTSSMTYQGTKIVSENFMSNFKPVNGIILPFSFESTMNGQVQSVITVDEYLFDQEVDDSIFIKPEPKPKPQDNPEK